MAENDKTAERQAFEKMIFEGRIKPEDWQLLCLLMGSERQNPSDEDLRVLGESTFLIMNLIELVERAQAVGELGEFFLRLSFALGAFYTSISPVEKKKEV